MLQQGSIKEIENGDFTFKQKMARMSFEWWGDEH